MFKLMDKKIITILCQKVFLSAHKNNCILPLNETTLKKVFFYGIQYCGEFLANQGFIWVCIFGLFFMSKSTELWSCWDGQFT